MSVVIFVNFKIDNIVKKLYRPTQLNYPRSGAMEGFHGNKRSFPASEKWVGPPSRHAPDLIRSSCSEQLSSEPQSLLEMTTWDCDTL